MTRNSAKIVDYAAALITMTQYRAVSSLTLIVLLLQNAFATDIYTSGFEGRCDAPELISSVAIGQVEWRESSRLGQRQKLSAVAYNGDGSINPCARIIWSSQNESLARVDSAGLVTAHGTGPVEIYASAEGSLAEDALPLFIYSGVPSTRPGNMYTVWSARAVKGAAVLVNGVLKTVNNPVVGNLIFPSPWLQVKVTKYQWAGDRLGILSDVVDGAGTFRVIDRHSEWQNLAIGGAVDFQLDGGNIGLLTSDGRFRVKSGIHGAWIQLATTGIKAFDFEDNRYGVLREDGVLLLKDSLNDPWDVLNAGGKVKSFKMQGSIVGVLLEDDSFGVYSYIADSWTLLDADVKQFELLAPERIAVVRHSGFFRIKDGIHNPWVVLANEGVERIELSDNRIAALYESGLLRVKNGINGLWRNLASADVKLFALQQGYIGIVRDNGDFLVKQGLDDPWSVKPGGVIGDKLSALSLAVAVRDPPRRTVPSSFSGGLAPAGLGGHSFSYPDSRTECDQNKASGRPCESVSVAELPVAHYGRWCGQGVPGEGNVIDGKNDLEWARGVGPIDSFDYLCRHHDNKNAYYGEETNAGTFDACVVRYGIDHARLTSNGVLIDSNHAAWESTWSTMWNLWDVVFNYGWYTSVCTNTQLGEFISDTDAVNW